MCNYLSFGIDARIGYGFDIHRSTSPFKNKCVYCCEGFKRMCCYKVKINNVIESLDIVDQNNFDFDLEDLSGKEIVLFDKQQQQQGMIDPTLPQPPPKILKSQSSALVCININSYMGGASDI
eukprot:TRINITY_DN18120_c0_g1_i1.p4 TRINITY_DN18120_c0_g1~~TRINITY_DN18120_c0_g1_i1.p4  ORF type:complete len:122 (+),score=17.01 TRINITY_DN18120_c0_g1_i1:424-789(+)